MNTFGFRCAEKVTHKFGLQHGFPTRAGDAATRSVHKMAIRFRFFDDFLNRDFTTRMGIPSVSVMTILAAKQAPLQEDNKADSWAINSATRFERVNSTNGRHERFSVM
ncbi:Uncharacterised protein [Vibrio cholerae]|nr:Uncharacterised protein [Vibrio cholerae]CSA14319.1 Uncharacterised protein [Vibrio cholerae]CSA20777.1 Uncharacterised protein [Vibrio cholerae]CSB30635.1 Uncharacterised protein [Vibrio cholerae]CSB91185.1 Uncharacterised protein [Vibrio cholerae]